MTNLLLWLMGTVRPISFFAFIPVVIGQYLAGSWHLDGLYASMAAVCISCIANSLNNVVDRSADQAAGKWTLAIESLPAGVALVILLFVPMAILLQLGTYNHLLAATILCLSCLYSIVPNRLAVVKRIAVGLIVAATSFLAVGTPLAANWLWALFILGIIYNNERCKDEPDEPTDITHKFIRVSEILRDRWCVAAPILAGGIFIASWWLSGRQLAFPTFLGALAIALLVIGYLHIRAQRGRYRIHFGPSLPEGRLALLAGLTSLTPLALWPIAGPIIAWNSASMLIQSALPAQTMDYLLSKIHSAQLWSSIPLLVIGLTNAPGALLVGSAILIFVATLVVTHINTASPPLAA